MVKPAAVFTVTSKGEDCEEILLDLRNRKCNVPYSGKEVLSELDSTTGVSYRIGLLRARDISNGELTFPKVRKFGRRNGYKFVPIEVGHLLQRAISPQAMKDIGINWVACMHKPVDTLCYYSSIIGFGHKSISGPWFEGVRVFYRLCEWGSIPLVFKPGNAFAFLMPD